MGLVGSIILTTLFFETVFCVVLGVAGFAICFTVAGGRKTGKFLKKHCKRLRAGYKTKKA